MLPYEVKPLRFRGFSRAYLFRSHAMEAPPGFEPGVKDLQSHALPLGYGAVVGRRSLHFSFRRRAKPIGEKFRIRSRLPPLKSKTMFCICFRVRYVSLYESVPCGTEKWSGRRGSNSLPPPWQGGALPDELRPHRCEQKLFYHAFCICQAFFRTILRFLTGVKYRRKYSQSPCRTRPLPP